MNFVTMAKRFAGKIAIIGLALAILGGCKPREDVTFLLRTDENHGISSAEISPAADIQEARVTQDSGVYRVEIELPWGTVFPDNDVFTYEVRFRTDRYDLPNLTITWRIDRDTGNRDITEAHLLDVDTGSRLQSRPVLCYRNGDNVVLETKFSMTDLHDRIPFDANCYMKPKEVSWADAGPLGILASSYVFHPEEVTEEEAENLFGFSPARIDMQYMVEGFSISEFWATYVSTRNERVELPADKEVRVPDTWRWRPVKFPTRATCPPSPWNSVTDLDLDMNPNTREGKYNDGMDNLDNRLDLPDGTKKITVLLYCLGPEPATGANSWFCPTLVVDTDGDGVGSAEEICNESTDVVGQCVYPRGRNSWHLDTNNHLKWITRDYGSGDDPFKFTGKWKMYDYDPATGELTIVTVTKNFGFDPEQPEPAPNDEVEDEDGNMRKVSRELDRDLNWKFLKRSEVTTSDQEWRWSRMSGAGCNPGEEEAPEAAMAE